jgi:hypothetical protein
MTRDSFYYLLSFTCLVIMIGWLLFVTFRSISLCGCGPAESTDREAATAWGD